MLKTYYNGSLSESHEYNPAYLENQCNPHGTCYTCTDAKLLRDGYCVPQEQGCGEKFWQVGNKCNRLSYTPPEAAEQTSENNNMLLIRYK